MIKNPSILICTPCKSGFVHINYMLSLMHSMPHLTQRGIIPYTLFDVGKSGIDIPRSQMATYFLKSEHTHLMFIDDDMAWPPDLIARMIELDCDIVGVPYRHKTPDIVYNMRIANGIEQSLENSALLNVHDIATGLLLIKKHVFEALKDKVDVVKDHKTRDDIFMFFKHCVVKDDLTEPDNDVLSYMSEDLYFCRLAREAGFLITAYVDAETGHTGTTTFKGNYSDILEKESTEKFKDVVQKQTLRLTGAVDG